jgi:hypothetical protein
VQDRAETQPHGRKRPPQEDKWRDLVIPREALRIGEKTNPSYSDEKPSAYLSSEAARNSATGATNRSPKVGAASGRKLDRGSRITGPTVTL